MIVCSGCGSGEVILSNNRTLAPPEMVQASNSLEGGGDIIVADATDVYGSGTSSWCTDNNDPDPYIDLQFTSPVLISRMLTRGFTRLRIVISCSIRRYYVTNFTLEYSPLDNSSALRYYTINQSANSSENKMVRDKKAHHNSNLLLHVSMITIMNVIVLFVT